MRPSTSATKVSPTVGKERTMILETRCGQCETFLDKPRRQQDGFAQFICPACCSRNIRREDDPDSCYAVFPGDLDNLVDPNSKSLGWADDPITDRQRDGNG